MPTTVNITEPLVFTLGHARVYTSPILTVATFDPDNPADGGWRQRPYLKCDSLRLAAGPEIDEAILSYEVGDFSARERPAWTTDDAGDPLTVAAVSVPLSLLQEYCKIEILNRDGVVQGTWYGVIEADDRNTAEKGVALQTGRQTFRAFGLVRLLEQTVIASSEVLDSAGVAFTIGRGLAFNADEDGAFAVRGNRAAGVSATYVGYEFSHEPRGQELWDGTWALQYLIEYHAPNDGAAPPTTAGNWFLNIGSLNIVDWYDITVQTERRTVKSVVDEICDRRRIIGYRVYGAEELSDFNVYLDVYTFANANIPLPGGKIIAANPNQIDLDFATSPLVTQRRIVRTEVHASDRVIVEGEYVVSVATFDYGDLDDGWTAAQEAEYLAGNLGGTDEVENTAARARDSMQDVFSRFTVVDGWDQQVEAIIAGKTYHVTIPYANIPLGITGGGLAILFDVASGTAGSLWFKGKTFQRRLPLKDATSNEFRPPFVLLKEQEAYSEVYRFANLLSVGSDDPDAVERSFNCSVGVLDDALGVRLRVNRAGAQQLIAAGQWSGAAATKAADDPDDLGNNAVSFETMLTTASFQWDERCRVEQVVRTVGAGAHERVQRIRIRDARLDIEIPGTITDVAANGELVESAGLILRDDRQRLLEISKAAAVWYGTERLAIDLTYRSVAPLVEIGELVASSDGVAVNTVITSIAYNFRDGSVAIATSFAEADFS